MTPIKMFSVAKISLIISAIVLSSLNAQAAPVSVNGSINSWKLWDQVSTAPYLPYLASKLGVRDLVNSTEPGLQLGYGQGRMSINVAGTIDSVTGFGTLSQIGSFTGYFDVDNDGFTDDSYANGGAGGAISFSGLTWTLDATGMHQTAGSATGCSGDTPNVNCAMLNMRVNSNDHSNGWTQSVFDFQGINAGFQTLPKSNGAQTTYGTIAKTWAATPGLAGSWSGLTYTAQLASRVNANNVSANIVNLANLSLTAVPVPAAAWLMGSGLIGLAGIARRKK